MDTQKQYVVIKNLVEHGGNKNRAALELGCSRRSINRYIAGYKAEGKAYFVHGNKGHIPVHKLDSGVKQDLIDLYQNKYFDANFAHYTELVQDIEGITVSVSTVRNILCAADILSPQATRRTRREYKARMEAKSKSAKTKKEKAALNSKIIASEDAHPRRPRCSRFGEMLQMDASLHLWFGDSKTTLHLAVDDATGLIVGAFFDVQETLNGYYNVFNQILTVYGIPYSFYTDRRTVFEYRKKGSGDDADDTFTQFGYACKQLGVTIKTTSIPQAKGRIERLNGTVQSRLPVELRLAGVTTVEQANEYLPQYIAKHNARFALASDSIPSVFETQPTREKINMTLAVVAERTVDTGHSIRYENKYFRTVNKGGIATHFRKGTKGLVVRTFDGGLYFSVESDGIFALDEIPEHERSSKDFDFKPAAEKPRKRYIPAASHPWRLAAYAAFVKKQAHRATSSG